MLNWVSKKDVKMQNLQKIFYNLLQNFDISYKRYFFDRVDFSEKLIGIIGDRGMGKTTFLLQYLLLELAGEFYSQGGKVLVIDEIQRSK